VNTPSNVARLIRKLRKHLGLSQQALAVRLGVALPTVSLWENRRSKPSPLALEKIEALMRDMGEEGEALIEKYLQKQIKRDRAMGNVRIDVPKDRIKAFCQRWKVKELSIFGSALRDDFGPDSDVDVLVELAPDHAIGLYEWVDMIDELKEIFGRDVDLVAKGGLKNPFRRKEILRTAEVVHAS